MKFYDFNFSKILLPALMIYEVNWRRSQKQSRKQRKPRSLAEGGISSSPSRVLCCLRQDSHCLEGSVRFTPSSPARKLYWLLKSLRRRYRGGVKLTLNEGGISFWDPFPPSRPAVQQDPLLWLRTLLSSLFLLTAGFPPNHKLLEAEPERPGELTLMARNLFIAH